MVACAGGMTLTMVMAHLAARDEPPINAAMLMVTMLDASVESLLTLLAEHQVLGVAKAVAEQTGGLTGQQLAQVFGWLRPNDLIWNHWSNNYLLGNDPPGGIQRPGPTRWA